MARSMFQSPRNRGVGSKFSKGKFTKMGRRGKKNMKRNKQYGIQGKFLQYNKHINRNKRTTSRSGRIGR